MYRLSPSLTCECVSCKSRMPLLLRAFITATTPVGGQTKRSTCVCAWVHVRMYESVCVVLYNFAPRTSTRRKTHTHEQGCTLTVYVPQLFACTHHLHEVPTVHTTRTHTRTHKCACRCVERRVVVSEALSTVWYRDVWYGVCVYAYINLRALALGSDCRTIDTLVQDCSALKWSTNV